MMVLVGRGTSKGEKAKMTFTILCMRQDNTIAFIIEGYTDVDDAILAAPKYLHDGEWFAIHEGPYPYPA